MSKKKVVKAPPKRLKAASKLPPGYERGVWHPTLVGVVTAYPVSQESFDRRREGGRKAFAVVKERDGAFPTRKGIPDGWGGNAAACRVIRKEAAAEAKEIIAIMVEKNIIPDDTDPRAKEALEFAIGVVRAKDPKSGQPAYQVKDHLAAAKIVLEWTKAKPASTQNVNLNAAESFLEELAAEKHKE